MNNYEYPQKVFDADVQRSIDHYTIGNIDLETMKTQIEGYLGTLENVSKRRANAARKKLNF